MYTAGALLCGLASSLTMLLAFRVLQGIGITMVFSTSVAILASAFPAQDRGRVLGINLAATYLALAVGPIAGGFITENLGWRGVFLANVPFGAILLLLTLWKLGGE
jgi:MFS family permease